VESDIPDVEPDDTYLDFVDDDIIPSPSDDVGNNLGSGDYNMVTNTNTEGPVQVGRGKKLAELANRVACARKQIRPPPGEFSDESSSSSESSVRGPNPVFPGKSLRRGKTLPSGESDSYSGDSFSSSKGSSVEEG
jgi:hypothetical protein